MVVAHQPPELLFDFIYQIGKSDDLRDRLRSGQMGEWCYTRGRAARST